LIVVFVAIVGVVLRFRTIGLHIHPNPAIIKDCATDALRTGE
jgi:hypothetical protein